MTLSNLVWGLRHRRLVSRLLIRYWAGRQLVRNGTIKQTFRLFRAQPDEVVHYFARLTGLFGGIARTARDELALRQRRHR